MDEVIWWWIKGNGVTDIFHVEDYTSLDANVYRDIYVANTSADRLYTTK